MLLARGCGSEVAGPPRDDPPGGRPPACGFSTDCVASDDPEGEWEIAQVSGNDRVAFPVGRVVVAFSNEETTIPVFIGKVRLMGELGAGTVPRDGQDCATSWLHLLGVDQGNCDVLEDSDWCACTGVPLQSTSSAVATSNGIVIENAFGVADVCRGSTLTLADQYDDRPASFSMNVVPYSGAACKPCADGEACALGSDCATRFCDAGVCHDNCSDGIQNRDETDVDCGGSCGLCGPGQHCTQSAECEEGLSCNKKHYICE